MGLVQIYLLHFYKPLFQQTEISVFGAQSLMKKVRFLSCLLKLFAKLYHVQTDGYGETKRDLSYRIFNSFRLQLFNKIFLM